MPTARAKRLVITGGQGAWLETSTGPATARRHGQPVAREHRSRAGAASPAPRTSRCGSWRPTTRSAGSRTSRRSGWPTAWSRSAPIRGAKVMLTSGGSDSVDLACKLARRHWQLEGRRAQEDHPEPASAPTTGCTPSAPASPGCSTTGTATARSRWSRRPPGSPPTTSTRSGAQLEQIGPDNVAAIIAEPVIGTGGVIGPAEGYLEGLAGPGPRARHPADRRRGHHRLRPRRADVRARSVTASPPT